MAERKRERERERERDSSPSIYVEEGQIQKKWQRLCEYRILFKIPALHILHYDELKNRINCTT